MRAGPESVRLAKSQLGRAVAEDDEERGAKILHSIMASPLDPSPRYHQSVASANVVVILLVAGREQDYSTVKTEQKTIKKDLTLQVRALQDGLEQQEEVQAKRLSTRNKEDELQSQVLSLYLKLNAASKEREARGNQVTKIGPCLKAREEKDQLQIGNLEDECENLGTKVQALMDSVQDLEVQATSSQREIQCKGDNSSSQFDELQRKLQDQETAHQEEMQRVQAQFSTLESQLQDLASLQKPASSTSEYQGNPRPVSVQLQGLQAQCSSQVQQMSSMSSRLEKVAMELQSQSALNQDSKDQIQTQEKNVASRIESLVDDLQHMIQQQGNDRGSLDTQISDLGSKIQSLQDQEVLAKRFQTNVQSQLAEAVDKTQSLKLELGAHHNQQQANRRDVQNNRFAVQEQIRQLSLELPERVEVEVGTLRPEFTYQIQRLQEAQQDLRAENYILSNSLQDSNTIQASKAQELTKAVHKCTSAYQDLQQDLVLAHDEHSSLHSRVYKQEKLLSESKENHADLKSMVHNLSIEGTEHAESLQRLREHHEGTKNVQSSYIGTIESKVAQLEQRLVATAQNTETQCMDAAKMVSNLSEQVNYQESRLVEFQEGAESGLYDLEDNVKRLNKKVQIQDILQQEKFHQVGLRHDDLEGKHDDMASGINAAGKELDRLRQSQLATQADFRWQVEPTKANMKEILTNYRREAGELESKDLVLEAQLEGADLSDTEDADANSKSQEPSDETSAVLDLNEKPLNEAEKEQICLSTKWVAFKAELQRRAGSVAVLEGHTQERSDSFLSRTEVTTHEIELQREQLKKWDELIQKNANRLKENRDKGVSLAVKVARSHGELQEHQERVSELEAALKEDGVSPVLEACLGNKLRVQKQHLDEWKKKSLALEEAHSGCEIECSKLAAKQELYGDELKRRQGRLGALRSKLRDILDMVTVEREDLESKLSLERKGRDLWREKTEILEAEVDTPSRKTQALSPNPTEQKEQNLLEEDKEGAQVIGDDDQEQSEQTEEIPSARDDLKAKRRRSMLKFTYTMNSLKQSLVCADGELAAPPDDDVSVKHDAIVAELAALKSHMEARQKFEERQQTSFEETKEALETQVEDAKKYCKEIAEKMDKITDDLNTRERLTFKVDKLQGELKSREEQLFHFEEGQSKLRMDLVARVESLQGEIRALEELQANTTAAQEDQKHCFVVLSEQVESMATKLGDHGDNAARIDALSDGIQKCEAQLTCFDKGHGRAETEKLDMVDSFKREIQALKHRLQDKAKDVEFTGLLATMENLVNDSSHQGSQLEHIEAALRDSGEFHAYLTQSLQETSANAQDQAEDILKTMNDKFIDLASRIDILTGEGHANGAKISSLELKARDWETLYLSEMNAVQQELKTRQTQHQQEIQVRIYNAMTQLSQHIYKHQHASRFLTWNATEESLALQQYRACNGGNAKERKRATDDGEARVQALKPNNVLAARMGSAGYSMTSGIVRNNLYVPAMMVPVSNVSATKKRDDSPAI